jgi:acyl-coenzyme A thioesterase PaaI-like protein
MKPANLRRLMNLWPPYLAAGIRVREIAPDWRRVRVDLVAHWWNRNYVGTHFGGSLFAMTDPFYMLMFINLLGPDYIVWDYAAHIRFVKPGRGTVSAQFEVDESEIERVVHATRGGERHIRDYSVAVHDRDGDEVARVQREVYFRRKRPERESGR